VGGLFLSLGRKNSALTIPLFQATRSAFLQNNWRKCRYPINNIDLNIVHYGECSTVAGMRCCIEKTPGATEKKPIFHTLRANTLGQNSAAM
jgi:hypothetical protein